MKFLITNDPNQIKSLPNSKRVDLTNLFIKDLFELRHPNLYKKASEAEFDAFEKSYPLKDKSVWVYYPWLDCAYKILKENDFFEILTVRNKPYVSVEEQYNFYNYNVGVVGLSVGQSSALTIVRSGGSKNIKIADPDTVSPSNLNRLHLGIGSIGKSKTEQVKEKLLEINPFTNIIQYDKGVTTENIEKFFLDKFKLNVVIDACDNIRIKLLIRSFASKYRVPIIMATDVGDGSLIDIERHDIIPNIDPFGGRYKNIKDPNNFLKNAVTIISPEYIPLVLQDRFFEIGRSVPTHPQLANSAYFSGTIISYLVRCLANNKEIVDERVYIDYDDLFSSEHKKKNFQKYKKAKIETFKNLLGME